MTIDWRIIAVFIVALVIAFATLLVVNADLRANLASARAESAALHIDNASFKAKVDQQNKAIIAWQTQATARAKRITAAENGAKKTFQKHMDAAANLKTRKAGSNGCDAAETLIDAYIKGLP